MNKLDESKADDNDSGNDLTTSYQSNDNEGHIESDSESEASAAKICRQMKGHKPM